MKKVDDENYIDYALSKQVPSIAQSAVFDTNYGNLILDEEDSAKVAALVAKLLRRKLAHVKSPNAAHEPTADNKQGD